MLLLFGIVIAVSAFLQIKKGVAYGKGGRRYERANQPICFWAIVAMFLALSGYLIGLAIVHWR